MRCGSTAGSAASIAGIRDDVCKLGFRFEEIEVLLDGHAHGHFLQPGEPARVVEVRVAVEQDGDVLEAEAACARRRG